MDIAMNVSSPSLPPGFRFHPTDQELILHYLKQKISSSPSSLVSIIADVNIYKFNPWELPGKALFGDSEWFFFSPRDRKYPNGARPNRAAASGYWKATGTDKPILNSNGSQCLGVKKTLVFYHGRPPKGIKTNWMMLEYRLIDDTLLSQRVKGSMRLDNWVLCRLRQKSKIHNPKDIEEHDTVISCSNSPFPFGCLQGQDQITIDNNATAERYPKHIKEHDTVISCCNPPCPFGCLQGQDQIIISNDATAEYSNIYDQLQDHLMAPQEIEEADHEQRQLRFTIESPEFSVSNFDSRRGMVTSHREAIESARNVLPVGALDEILQNASNSVNNEDKECIFQVSSPTLSAADNLPCFAEFYS